MSKITLILFSFIVVSYFGVSESFADELTVKQDCKDSILTISVQDEDMNPIEDIFVHVYQDTRATSKHTATLTSNENGIVSFEYSDKTRSANISQPGFGDKRILLMCDDILKVKPLVEPVNTKHCEILLESESSIYGSEQQKAFLDPVCQEFLREHQYPSKIDEYILNTPSIPKWIKVVTTWWLSGDISDSEFMKIISYLISENIISIPPEIVQVQSFDDFPYGQEKEYLEPMNVIGKTIRVFDDKICVEQYCSYEDTLKTLIETNAGSNTKKQIKLALCLITIHDYGGCNFQDLITGTKNGKLSGLSTENKGNGFIKSEWTVRKYTQEGSYYVFSVIDGKPFSPVADTMQDLISGNFNHEFTVVNYN